jgi:hypothetical protein
MKLTVDKRKLLWYHSTIEEETMTDEQVVEEVKKKMKTGKLFVSDLEHYCGRSRQMLHLQLIGQRKWKPSDIIALRGLLEKFTVIT